MGFYGDAVFVRRVIEGAIEQHAHVCRNLVDALSRKHDAYNSLTVHKLVTEVMRLTPTPKNL